MYYVESYKKFYDLLPICTQTEVLIDVSLPDPKVFQKLELARVHPKTFKEQNLKREIILYDDRVFHVWKE